MSMVDPFPDVTRRLEAQALSVLGHTDVTGADGLPATVAGTLILIGPREPEFWTCFTGSPEYADSQPDPLDRWSRRVLDDIAVQTATTAVYPFGEPPYHPFHTWALRSGRFWVSPIGFLVHDTMGLFASFRGALLAPPAPATDMGSRPCDTCATMPCASACPVDAFADGYNVAACKAHINSPAGRDCIDFGCRARRACPVGQGNRLPDQAAFHMRAFQ